jgi:type VI secretion system secreted protein VgrG
MHALDSYADALVLRWRIAGVPLCSKLRGKIMAAKRFATVTTPLGDALELERMTGSDTLGEPFAYELDLISPDANIEESSLLGTSVTVNLDLPDDSKRYFNGIVASLEYGGTIGRYSKYHMTLRPWLWLLSHASDCRIFQRINVPDLVKGVFKDHGFSDFELNLSNSYPERNYIVQYRETTLVFVERLLEHEGIYYYFRHEEGRHILVLADSIAAHQTASGYEEVPYYTPGNTKFRERENIERWHGRNQIRTGAYAHTDYDFTKPKADLMVKTVVPGDYAHSEKEFYDYPGTYDSTSEGDRYARSRIEELQGNEASFSGQGITRGLGSGHLFSLTGFPRDKLNCQYLVVSARYTLDVSDYESFMAEEGDEPFRCALTATMSKVPYVAPRLTPRPLISGPQTATVVGKEGAEIWTDEFGRVKVQFHWDREGKRDENSSCWVRVSQLWAGSGWGGIHIPRIGQEVIVEFMEGDPDRPIITGRVYNRDNMPPYILPRFQTQSGIKSHSTKDGKLDNFNEIRFEDLKDQEQVYIQAERNMDTLVKNDQTLTVNANRTKTIEIDETTEVGGNRTEKVVGNENIRIEGTRTETVLQTETIVLEQARSTTITLGDTLKVGQGYMVTVGAAASLAVTGAQSVTVGEAHSLKVSGSDSVSVAQDQNLEIGGARMQKVKSDHLNSATKVMIDAGSEITLKAGAASLTLKASGEIVLNGTTVTVKGSETVNIRALSDVLIKGARNLHN